MSDKPLSQLIGEMDDAYYGEYGHMADAVREIESQKAALESRVAELERENAAMREAGDRLDSLVPLNEFTMMAKADWWRAATKGGK